MAIIYPKSYCVFDFETSGLDDVGDSIIEIGALRVKNGVVEAKESWLINYGPKFVVPEVITKITSITAEMLSFSKFGPAEALAEFLKFTQGLPLVGHNIIAFDLKFLFAAYKRYGDAATLKEFKERVIPNCVDTAALYKARKLKADRHYNESLFAFSKRVVETKAFGVKYNVAVACDELGIDKSKATQHRADGDVYLTNEIYKKLCLSK